MTARNSFQPAVYYDGEPWAILEKYGAGITRAVPFGTVLTLPATGSGNEQRRRDFPENLSRAKLPFANPLVFPKFSALDPTKTYTLPPRQIANGVVDTFVHIMEQYLTYPVNGKVQDRFFRGFAPDLD